MSFWSFLTGAKPEPALPFVPKFLPGDLVRHRLTKQTFIVLDPPDSAADECLLRHTYSYGADFVYEERHLWEEELELVPPAAPDEKPVPEQPVKKSRPARKR